MRRAMTAVTILLATAVPIGAQSSRQAFDWSAAAVIGGGTTWDDEGQIGDGVLAGGRLDGRITGQTFWDVSVDYLRHHRTGGFNADGHTTLVTGTVVQRFGNARAQPYALGGITVARHSGTYGFLPDTKVGLAESTDLGFVFGGGLAVRVGRQLEIGPEARFYILNADVDSSPAFASWLGGRIGVRF